MTATTPSLVVHARTGSPASGARMLAHQARFELRAALRNRVYLGFTLAMPLIMLVTFSVLLGQETIEALALAYQAFLVPNVVVLGLLSSCFASLGILLAIRRGTGELKRVRGTPVPPWVVLAAPALNAALVGCCSAVLVVATGRWVFGVDLPAIGPFLVLLLVAPPCLAAMGIAIATFVQRPENGPAVTNIVMWPVTFVSGTFTFVEPGTWLHRLSQALPVRHLNDAALATFPAGGGTVRVSSLVVLVAWGLVGAVVAVRRFGWDPPRQS